MGCPSKGFQPFATDGVRPDIDPLVARFINKLGRVITKSMETQGFAVDALIQWDLI